jgi:hypothetical protein
VHHPIVTTQRSRDIGQFAALARTPEFSQRAPCFSPQSTHAKKLDA